MNGSDLDLKIQLLTPSAGLWAVDFADDNPNVEVIGTDISPVQPQWVPPNLRL